MGRVSKAQSAENRALIVAAAAGLLRERGLAAVNIADIMAAAGLTHGGFYRHFCSKEALAAEAIALAFDQVERAWAALAVGSDSPDFQSLAKAYLGTPQGNKCPVPTLAFDVASAPAGSAMRVAYSQGVRRLASVMGREDMDQTGLAMLAALVGARLLGAAIDDPALAGQINAAVIAIAAGRATD
jgi:TetR/AcrR family transcriptional repressor of nem operon